MSEVDDTALQLQLMLNMQSNFSWNLCDLFGISSVSDSQSDFALVILNRPLKADQVFFNLWKNARVRVAADGAANHVYDLLTSERGSSLSQIAGLDAIVGDLDSIHPSVEEYFRSLQDAPSVIRISEQELSDVDKSVNWIYSKYSHGIDLVLLGDLGGRVDHGLRQVHYLYLFQPDPGYVNGRVFLLTGDSLTVLLKTGSHQIILQNHCENNNIGAHAAIVPISQPSLVSTHGFERDATQARLLLGEAIHRSKISQTTPSIEIETSESILFTIDISSRL